MSRGLAAPQVGVSRRLIVCGIYGEIKELINPEIVETSGAYAGYENCLSLPDQERKIVNRPGFIKVKYKGLDNKEALLRLRKDMLPCWPTKSSTSTGSCTSTTSKMKL